MNDAFDLEEQSGDKISKIIAGVERLSTLFRAALLKQSKILGYSPLQIQIVLFIAYHSKEYCNTTYISDEFAVSKPTVSDSIRVLIEKRILIKTIDHKDARSFLLELSPIGKKFLDSLSDLSANFGGKMVELKESEIETIWNGILLLMLKLQITKSIPVRMCFSCNFFGQNYSKGNPHYCHLMEQPLDLASIRIDCPEYYESNLAGD